MNPLLNLQLFCSTNNEYDLQSLIQKKYIQPLLSHANSVSYSYPSQSLNDGKLRITGQRRARNYELSQFATQIRQIQNQSSQFYTIDNIIESLLLSNGDPDLAYNILLNGTSAEDAIPPRLPKRPNNEIKPAIFDGINPISSQYSNNQSMSTKANEPRPAIFDGSIDLTQSNPYQQGIIQSGIMQQQQQPMVAQPFLSQQSSSQQVLAHQGMIQQPTMASASSQPYITQTNAFQPQLLNYPQNTLSQQYTYPQNYTMPNYPSQN